MPWPYNMAVLHVVIVVCLQVSWLNPTVHVFGHQHRNWDMVIVGVKFVAHCLGSPNDQRDGYTWGDNVRVGRSETSMAAEDVTHPKPGYINSQLRVFTCKSYPRLASLCEYDQIWTINVLFE